MKFFVIGLVLFIAFVALKLASDSLGKDGIREFRSSAKPYLTRLAIAIAMVLALVALAFSGASIRLL